MRSWRTGTLIVGVALVTVFLSARVAGLGPWTPVYLGTLGGPGAEPVWRGLNDNGMVVGISTTAANEWHAFAWTEAEGMVDLGTLGGAFSSAERVNGAGLVAGSSDTASGERHAFVWSRDLPMTDLTLGGTTPPGWGNVSTVTDINEHGMVVGQSKTPADETHAFSWTQSGGIVDLETLGGSSSTAARANDAGMVVGGSALVTGETHAFAWTEAGGMIDLGTLGGTQSSATDVNEAGVVVGSSTTSTGETHAFAWTADRGMLDLGAPGAAWRVNENGMVMGWLSMGSQSHPFFWSDATGLIEVGPLGAETFLYPIDFNDNGMIVGYAGDYYTARAFVWTPETGIVDLGTLGGSRSFAENVNNDGIVVGYSSTANGRDHAFVWTQAEGMVDLTPSLTDAFSYDWGISDSGLISGVIYTPGGGGVLWRAPQSTPGGSDVTVTPVDAASGEAPASVTFSEVTQPGLTSVVISSSGPPLPSGFSLGDPPLYYDISTTASYTGAITVCIDYTGVTTGDESTLQLLHFSDGQWLDITSWRDTEANTICGQTPSLSPFVVASPPPTLTVRPMFDQNRTHKAGSTIPIRIQILDGEGVNVSSLDLSVVATGVRLEPDGAWMAPEGPGRSNPGLVFRFTAVNGEPGYQFNLKSSSDWQGLYELRFRVGSDGMELTVDFAVR